MRRSQNRWLPHRGLREDARLRLFCLPHAGGGTAIYHRWASEFPAEVEIAPILLPGRERRLAEPAFTNLHEIVSALLDALEPVVKTPFAVFGHSMGALLSYEFCLELRRRQLALPRRLFVAAYRAPQLAPKSSPIHALPDAQFVAAIQDRFGGIPAEIAQTPELLALFLPSLRADVTAIETYNYQPEPALECGITALGGIADPQVTMSDLAAWRQQTTADFTQKMLPGGHFFVSQSMRDVSRIVRRQLECCLD